jgi:hypothetical protein
MARFRGTVCGGRGEASRLGHATSGLNVCAQSYSGDVTVRFHAHGDEDYVCIQVGQHGRGYPDVTLYDGPIATLLEQSGRKTLVTALAKEFIMDEAA